MALDITVTNNSTGETKHINWLRNSFGLCQWAEQNYLFALKLDGVPGNESLYYACNHWNYHTGHQIDKRFFLETVLRYGSILLNISSGYFFFTSSALDKTVMPNAHLLTHPLTIQPVAFWNDYGSANRSLIAYYGINQEAFVHDEFHLFGKHHLSSYKLWYQELIDIAIFLQRPEATFYCSN